MSPRLRRSVLSLVVEVLVIGLAVFVFLPDLFWESMLLLAIPLLMVVLAGIDSDRLHWASLLFVIGIDVACAVLVGTADSAFAGLWFVLLFPVAAVVFFVAKRLDPGRRTLAERSTG